MYIEIIYFIVIFLLHYVIYIMFFCVMISCWYIELCHTGISKINFNYLKVLIVKFIYWF